MTISRREIMAGAIAAQAVATTVATSGRALAESMTPRGLLPTGQETLGPFFPVRIPPVHDQDITHYPGKTGRAKGQIIELTGRVMDVKGNPLPNAQMLIWQANAAGRYVNPVDTNTAPIDPNFLGVTSFGVDARGHYRLRTVKPGAYPEPSGTMRTPHIHFDVTNADYRLVAQMYFPGEALNEHDLLLSTLASRHRKPEDAICKPGKTSEPNVLAFEWNIVLLT
jgi:protocatechuate 3,4-dioxygenase beta subunit